MLNGEVTRTAQAPLYRYCWPAESIIDSKGPPSHTIAPSVLAELNKKVKLVTTGQKKTSGLDLYESCHTRREGLSNPVRQHQWSLTNWLASWAQSTWPSIRMASQHDHTCVHVRGLAIATSVSVQRRSFARVAVTKIKTTKINSEGLFPLFTKFSTPENYPPYGRWTLQCNLDYPDLVYPEPRLSRLAWDQQVH